MKFFKICGLELLFLTPLLAFLKKKKMETDLSAEAYEFLNTHIKVNCSMLLNDLLKESERNSNLQNKYWYDQLYCQYLDPDIWEEDPDWIGTNYCPPEPEPELRHPNKFYIVSDWFAARLKEHNQLLTDYWGFWIWGRETINQGIIFDYVFQKIYQEDFKLQQLYPDEVC